MNLQQLIKEAKQGSSAAEKCLFDEMADSMLLVCCRYVKNREDAEEILLNGFFRFFKNMSSFQFQHDAALYSWVKKMMINECLMFLRKKKSFSMVTEKEADDISLQEDALSNLSAAEIFSLIIQLPVGYRTVFNLSVMEDMDHKEIAGLLGIAEGTSRSQLSKAKSMLQHMLIQKGVTYERNKYR